MKIEIAQRLKGRTKEQLTVLKERTDAAIQRAASRVEEIGTNWDQLFEDPVSRGIFQLYDHGRLLKDAINQKSPNPLVRWGSRLGLI